MKKKNGILAGIIAMVLCMQTACGSIGITSYDDLTMNAAKGIGIEKKHSDDERTIDRKDEDQDFLLETELEIETIETRVKIIDEVQAEEGTSEEEIEETLDFVSKDTGFHTETVICNRNAVNGSLVNFYCFGEDHICEYPAFSINGSPRLSTVWEEYKKNHGCEDPKKQGFYLYDWGYDEKLTAEKGCSTYIPQFSLDSNCYEIQNGIRMDQWYRGSEKNQYQEGEYQYEHGTNLRIVAKAENAGIVLKEEDTDQIVKEQEEAYRILNWGGEINLCIVVDGMGKKNTYQEPKKEVKPGPVRLENNPPERYYENPIFIDNNSPVIDSIKIEKDYRKKKEITVSGSDQESGVKKANLFLGNCVVEEKAKQNNQSVSFLYQQNGDYRLVIEDLVGNNVSYTWKEEGIWNQDLSYEVIDVNGAEFVTSLNPEQPIWKNEKKGFYVKIKGNCINGKQYPITECNYSLNQTKKTVEPMDDGSVSIHISDDQIQEQKINELSFYAKDETGNEVSKTLYWGVDLKAPIVKETRLLGESTVIGNTILFKKNATLQLQVEDENVSPKKLILKGFGEKNKEQNIELTQSNQSEGIQVIRRSATSVEVKVTRTTDQEENIDLTNCKVQVEDELGNVGEYALVIEGIDQDQLIIDAVAPRMNIEYKQKNNKVRTLCDGSIVASEYVDVCVMIEDNNLFGEGEREFLTCVIQHQKDYASEPKEVRAVWEELEKDLTTPNRWKAFVRLGKGQSICCDEGGIYTITMKALDAIGNESKEVKKVIYIDTIPPRVTNVTTSNGMEWTNQPIKISFDVSDDYPGKVSSVWNHFDGNESFLVPADEIASSKYQKCVVSDNGHYEIEIANEKDQYGSYHIWAYDDASNVSNLVNVPVKLDVTSPEAEFLPIAKKILNEDAKLTLRVKDVFVNDRGSGINEIRYVIYCDGKASEEQVISCKGDESVEKNIVVTAKDHEGEKIWVEANVTDQAGNEASVKSETFCIDTTSPEIVVRYEQNDAKNGYYFNHDRKAIVQITEKHFDEALVKWNTKGQIGHFSSNGEVHTAEVLFHEDGEYSLAVECTDLSENESHNTTYEGVATEQFVIDQTSPTLEISFDQQRLSNGKFCNQTRTLILTAIEDNIDMNDISGIQIKRDGEIVNIGAKNWSQIGGKYTTTIQISEDGTYQFSAQIKDKAENVSNIVTSEEFIMDQQAPEIHVSGIKPAKAYGKEKVAPIIEVHDMHFDSTQAKVKLRGAKLGDVTSQLKISMQEIENGMRFSFPEIQEDDMYVLSVYAKDLAGNKNDQMELNGKVMGEIRFSVNRKGSVFSLDPETEKILQSGYIREPQDIILLETNVNLIQNCNIIIMKDQKEIQNFIISSKEKQTQKLDGCMIERKDVNGGWSQYSYRLSKSMFQEDGIYQIAIRSEDEAGNVTDNVLVPDYEISFAIDQTKPIVMISDLESEKVYHTTEKKVSFSAKDNGNLSEVSVYLNGKQVAFWDEEGIRELVRKNENYSFMIPESIDEQTVTIYCKDAAGNSCEDVQINKFYVTTDTWTEIKNDENMKSGGWVASAVFLIGAVFGILIFRKKKEN